MQAPGPTKHLDLHAAHVVAFANVFLKEGGFGETENVPGQDLYQS